MKKLTLLMTLFLLSLNAQALSPAGFFVEPMATYERGDGEIDLPSPLSSDDTELNGFGVGARVGFHIVESIFIGADGRYSFPKLEDDDLGIDSDATAWNWGPSAGIQMPTLLGLRVWGTWILGSEIEADESDNDLDLKFKDGKGFRIGAGVKIGWASLNLEYQDLTYDDLEVSGPVSGDFNSVEFDNKSWILGVSF